MHLFGCTVHHKSQDFLLDLHLHVNSGGVLVLMKFGQFSPECKETVSSGATESEV